MPIEGEDESQEVAEDFLDSFDNNHLELMETKALEQYSQNHSQTAGAGPSNWQEPNNQDNDSD